VRLCIFHHPFGAIVRDLLLGFGRGDWEFPGNRNQVVIMREWLVVLHVIALVKLSMMRAEDLLEGRCQILQQMESVGNLGGLWRPLPNAGGLGFGAVTGHHCNIGMRLEPRGDGFRRPILE